MVSMCTILVVDDSDSIRNLLQLVLEDAGHTCVVAEDGRKGLELFHSHKVDLVITDIYMPEADGLETIMGMRREKPDLPIIAITGAGNAMDNFQPLQVANAFGANACMSKPFSNAELVETVNKLLS